MKLKAKNIKLMAGAIFLLMASSSIGQKLTEEDAIRYALQNNQSIKSAEQQVEYYSQLKKTGSEIGKLSAVFMRGQYNTIEKDNNIALTQSIPFPTSIGAQMKLGEERIVGSNKKLMAVKNTLVYDVKVSYEKLLFQIALHDLLLSQDSMFIDFARASAIRYKTGEGNLLEMTTAESNSLEVKNTVRQNEADIFMEQRMLQVLMKNDQLVEVAGVLKKRNLEIDLSSVSLDANPDLQTAQQMVRIYAQEKRLEKNRLLPDLLVGYFNQTLIGYQNTTGSDIFYGKDKRFQGFTVGLSVPLWFAPLAARAKAASYLEESTRQSTDYLQSTLKSEFEMALRSYDKYLASLSYYENTALKNADLILTQAQKSFKGGEIGYVEYLQSLRSANAIKVNYLQALHHYNLSVIKIEFLVGR